MQTSKLCVTGKSVSIDLFLNEFCIYAFIISPCDDSVMWISLDFCHFVAYVVNSLNIPRVVNPKIDSKKIGAKVT